MVILMDADVLIKLNRIGALKLIAECFVCVIADAVFNEVVTKGKEIRRADAVDIETTIADSMSLGTPSHTVESRFGAGETELLALYLEVDDPIIVSDDRSFRNHAVRQGYNTISPAGLLVTAAKQNQLPKNRVEHFLRLLQPMTSRAAYIQALKNLEE